MDTPEHRAALPYRYYDVNTKTVVIRLIAPCDVLSVDILYGDPYNYRKENGAELWQYETKPLEQYFKGVSTNVWRIACVPPPWNRMMYGFHIKTADHEYYYAGELMPYTAASMDYYYNHFFYPYIHAVDAPRAPQWVQKTVWYQIFPERFCRGNSALTGADLEKLEKLEKLENWEHGEPTPHNFFGGDLRGIQKKLPYLKDLGINGIYLTPIFKSPSNHKYDTEDYLSIDEHFGTAEDLKQLVSDAHAAGIRIMLDAVFNHAGKSHPFWQDVLKNQEQSPYKDYFHIHSFPVYEQYTDAQSMNYECFGFYSRMPKWNTDNPHVRQYLIDAALYWIKIYDIDALRLDVANEVSFDFWREFSQQVAAVKEDFYILGEVWYDASPWINHGYFDAVMHYPLGFALAEYFLEQSLSPDQFTEKLVKTLSYYSDLHNRISFNLLDSHDTSRALTKAHNDKCALKNAFTLLFLLPGAPCIFYGTEVGINGGHDPKCRKPMIWDEQKQDKALYSFFKRLIQLRLKYINVINNAVIRYIPHKDSALNGCWTFSYNETVLSFVHIGKEDLKKEIVEAEYGTVILTTGSDTAEHIAAGSVAVLMNIKERSII